MPRKKKPALDDLLSFKELAKHVPPRGCHWMTVYRWHHEGILIGRGRLKLQSTKICGRVYSTRRWLAEYLAKQQEHVASRDHLLAESRSDTERALERELAS